MRALLVVNPQATSTTAARRDVITHALASVAKLDIVETSCRGHAEEAAANARANDVRLVVVHGGDGTVNEVVNGLLRDGINPENPMLGVVPGGSANVFARALGIPKDPFEATHELLLAIENGHSRSIGLGKVAGRWFTFNAGVGWDADVVAEVDRRRSKKVSPLFYTRLTLSSYLRQLRNGPELTIQLPDTDAITGLRMAFISNTDPWTYLGAKPIRLNPGCSFDGGLGVFALSSITPLTVARTSTQVLIPKLQPKGEKLLRNDNVSWVHVNSRRPVRLQVDGDDLGERSSARFESMPDALQVAVLS